MIKFENFEVVGWEHAIRGMRNAKNSWEKSDSCKCGSGSCDICVDFDNCPFGCDPNKLVIGPNDLKLMRNLRNAGTDHRKYLRMIVVYVDIIAPLYWWKEFDTYKVGTVANSCSTMHTIHEKEFTLEDFSHEKLIGNDRDFEMIAINQYCNEINATGYIYGPLEDLKYDIEKLNVYRQLFIRTKDKLWWEQMIQRLPSSYNQRRTVELNYEVLANMFHSREFHKLDEWREMCAWMKTLPYSELITGKVEEENES